MENSIDSENSSKYQDKRRGKIESLYKAFNDLNWDNKKNLTSEEIIYFLDINSQQKKFDPVLSEKLLLFLDMENQNSITVEDFIQNYIQFDTNLQNRKEEFNNKILTKQNSLNNLEEQCNKFKNEQLDSEGLCENAKLSIEIIDIDIKVDLTGLNIIKIIIELSYNNETQQKMFELNQEESDNNNKIFEFKPKRKTVNLIISLKYVTDSNEIIEIGSKEFPMNELTSQEEYAVEIQIPDKNDENIVAAIINSKILFYWSDYQYYVDKKRETELGIDKIKKAISETNKYCKEINEIYLKNMKIESQPNIENIKWNSQIIQPNIEQGKSSYIDIDNNNEANLKLNHDEYNQRFRNNAFDSNDNDDNYRNNQNPKMLCLTKIIGLFIFLIGIINGFLKNEFHNQLLGLLIFFNSYNVFKGNNEKTKFMNKFNFYFCLGILLYDIIWIFAYFNEETNEIFIGGKLMKFFVALNIITKGFGSVILFNIK